MIAKTRAEIRAIRAKYAAMKAGRVPAVARHSNLTSAQPFHNKGRHQREPVSLCIWLPMCDKGSDLFVSITVRRQWNRLEWQGLKEE